MLPLVYSDTTPGCCCGEVWPKRASCYQRSIGSGDSLPIGPPPIAEGIATSGCNMEVGTNLARVQQDSHTTNLLPKSADGTHLRSRSATRCWSTGAVLTDSRVQNAMVKVVKSAEAWADTHWIIHWIRKVAKTTPTPAQESWSHQGSLGRVSLVGVSPTCTSATFHDSVTALWSIIGATLGGWLC